MPAKKKLVDSPISGSPFKSADRLYKQEKVKSENQKRFERWTDVIIRERKLSPDWKDDPEVELKVKWIDGRSKVSPAQKKIKD